MSGATCNPDTGVCGPATGASALAAAAEARRPRLVVVTDPICSACWALEPSLRLLERRYGHQIDVDHCMGGLLPRWEGFGEGGGSIRRPEDVAPHWHEMGRHSGMSIDGDLWLEDPLPSSFPPSLAYHAARLLSGRAAAVRFLRRLRELVFLEKKNICREEHVAEAARRAGLDAGALLQACGGEAAAAAFEGDLRRAQALQARSFPTLVFLDADGQAARMVGVQPWPQLERGLFFAGVDLQQAREVPKDLVRLVAEEGPLATRELAVLLGLPDAEASAAAGRRAESGEIRRWPVRYGEFWAPVGFPSLP